MKKENKPKKRYAFIGKTLFFPKENILVVGDLHLGYEQALRNRGLEMPLNQFKEIIEEFERTINYIKAKYGKVGELMVVFLGDIKHHFNYLATEKEEVKELMSFFRKKGIDENRLIFIRGNHEKNDKNGKYIDYYIVKDIAFIHGHREFLEIYDKNINLIIMGHLHPSITLRDEMKIKNEKYKCFLQGRFKKKDFIILPSFLSLTEGVAANEMEEIMDNKFSIIPNKELDNFEVFVCQDLGEEALDFGKLESL